MESVYSEVDGGTLAHLDDLLLDLFLDLGHDLLDTCGMDAAVGYKLVQGQTCDLAAHGIETAEDDGLGRVVDDDLDARCGLQSTYVAALAADDAALDLVTVDVEYRNGILDGRLGSYTLDRGDDDTLGLLRGGEFGLLDGLVDVGCGLGLGLRLHVLDEDVLGVVGAHARDLLQTGVLLADDSRKFLLAGIEALQLVLHLLLEAVVILDLVVELALLRRQIGLHLLGALLALCDLLVAFVDLTVVLALELDELLLGLENLLLLDHFALGLGLLQGGGTLLVDGILGDECGHKHVYAGSYESRYDGCDEYYQRCTHDVLELLVGC